MVRIILNHIPTDFLMGLPPRKLSNKHHYLARRKSLMVAHYSLMHARNQVAMIYVYDMRLRAPYSGIPEETSNSNDTGSRKLLSLNLSLVIQSYLQFRSRKLGRVITTNWYVPRSMRKDADIFGPNCADSRTTT